MSTWNYRIVRFACKAGRNGFWYEVCEVYYDKKGTPEKYCTASIGGETIKECFDDCVPFLDGMRKAYLKYPEDFTADAIDRNALESSDVSVAIPSATTNDNAPFNGH